MKGRDLLVTVTAGLALMLGWASASRAQTEPVGFVAAVRGVVEHKAAGGAPWAAALVDDDVSVGDSMKTGVDSSTKVLLVDDTTLAIGEETELLIDSMVVGAAALTEPSILELLSGRVRTWVGEAFGGTTNLQMYTPTAVIGVKGSAYATWILQLGSQIYTVVCGLEGDIWVKNRNPDILGKLYLSAGICARIFADKPPEKTGEWPTEIPKDQAEPLPSSPYSQAQGGPPAGDDWLVKPPPVGLSAAGEDAGQGAPLLDGQNRLVERRNFEDRAEALGVEDSLSSSSPSSSSSSSSSSSESPFFSEEPSPSGP